jgi:hypothetical protein
MMRDMNIVVDIREVGILAAGILARDDRTYF